MARLIVNKKVIGNFDVGTKFQDIHDLIEKAGVEFGCTDGQCGVCVATVLRGLEALNEVSEKESDTLWRIGEYEEDRRLTCQLEIVKDTDVIELQTD